MENLPSEHLSPAEKLTNAQAVEAIMVLGGEVPLSELSPFSHPAETIARARQYNRRKGDGL